MKPFKFFWTTHKWTGIILSLIFVNLAVTGFLLLIKKEFAWIQPPSQKAAAGTFEEFVPLQKVFAAVLAEKHEDFASMADIDRIDFRPGKRLHKVRSKHRYAEMQVCAVTGEVLSVDWRPSDFIEQLHDGSWFGDWAHDYVLPISAISLAFLVVSGIYIWIAPILSKRRRLKKKRSSAPA